MEHEHDPAAPCACLGTGTRRQDRGPDPVAPASRSGRVVTYTVRAADVPLRYGDRVEFAPRGDLGDLRVGAPVEIGSHGGPVGGRIIAVRRTDAELIADLELASEAEAEEWIALYPQISADYHVGRLDSDGGQREVKIGAVALIPRGRCGVACSIRRDHDGPCYDESVPMTKIKIAGKEYVAGSPEAAAAMEAEGKRLDALDVKAKAEASRQIRAQARAATGLDVRQDAGDQDILIETVKKIAPGVDLSSASPDYIMGAFAVAIAMALDLKGKAAEPGPDDAPAPSPAGSPPPDRQDGAPATGAASARASVFNARRDAAANENKTTIPVYEPPAWETARAKSQRRANGATS